MARTAITPVSIAGGSSQQVAAVEFTWTAADPTNGNSFTPGTAGKSFVLVRNVNSDSPLVDRKVTLYNAKSGAIIEKTLGGGEYATFGQLTATGWEQSDSTVHIDGDHANIEIAVFTLP